VVDADTDPAGIVGDVIDAIGNRTPELRDDEIMDADLFGRALRPPFAPGILEVADQFLLFRINRDRRFARGQRRLDQFVDVVELRVPIGMVRSLARLRLARSV